MKLDDVNLSCQGCTLREQPQISDGSFYVRVPLAVDGTLYQATLHCRITDAGHEIELEMLSDEVDRPVMPDPMLEEKLDRAIGRITDLRLCGNERLCPEQVIRMVRAEA